MNSSEAWEPEPESEIDASTDSAIDSSDVPAEILEIFAVEAEEHLQTGNRCLGLLEARADDREALQELRRAVHTLKGAAASVGFDRIAKLAHRAEDLLDALFESPHPVPESDLKVIRAAHDALEEMAAGSPIATDVSALFARLDEALVGREPLQPAAELPEIPPLEIVSQEFAPQEMAETVRATGPMLKVPLARIDEAVKLLGEQVVSRSGLEEHLARFSKLVEELQLSAQRLQRATARLDMQYEARALAGGGLSPSANRLARFAPLRDQESEFDDLEFDRYTEFHLLSRELAETSTDIGTVANEFVALGADLDGYRLRQSRLTTDLQEKFMRVRMVPLSHIASRLQRTVRRTAESVGKAVRLLIEGERTELDKTVLEELNEPLLHLLRNSVDHGIEGAAARVACGKPEVGTITIRARRDGTQVVIEVGDDGKGIDPERVWQSAIAKGYSLPPNTDPTSADAVLDLLTSSGFSTAERVSEVSGRGVGLDAVKVTVERLKGTLELQFQPGRGTTFIIRLPLTLVVTRALLLRAGGQTFALPLGSVVQLLRLEPEMMATVGSRSVFQFSGQTYPRIHLADRLQLPSTGPAESRPPVILISVANKRYALVVDQIIGGREIVVKPFSAPLNRVPALLGATLMGDGSVVLILDPVDLLTSSTTKSRRSVPSRPMLPTAIERTVLVVDDSPSVRRIVTGQLRTAGYKALSARDGQDALEQLHSLEKRPDAVLLDVEMPRMDGYELLATLRANPLYEHLPIIMLTSRAGDKHRNKAVALGASAYLVKPYQPAQLLETVRRTLAADPSVV